MDMTHVRFITHTIIFKNLNTISYDSQNVLEHLSFILFYF